MIFISEDTKALIKWRNLKWFGIRAADSQIIFIMIFISEDTKAIIKWRSLKWFGIKAANSQVDFVLLQSANLRQHNI